MPTSIVHRPGEICPRSGEYAIVQLPAQRRTGHSKTMDRGERFPPTPDDNQGYVYDGAQR